ncbi:subunit 17 of mediator complex-domain-containing protein [Hypoxylon sp. NC1633]|nr:subunit 17 of mediator complex-domain-containing protein [Hypoxylon sp. NC1633]
MTSPFSLRPWPIGDKKPKNLGEFIARVNAERGGFRNVTEAKLREEVKAQEDGRAEVDGSSDSEVPEDLEEADADKSKNVIAAREEFLRNIEIAHQSAMLSLDFVSLLITKEQPTTGEMTLSPMLRDHVGIGTMGASKLKDSNMTEARKQDDLGIATGWRLEGIDSTVDSVVSNALKLEKEIESETKYWADVLAVSEHGWAVCALPYEPHTLGVRFGFAESTLEFRNSSIAPLRRNDDGSVHLQLGRVGGGAQRIRVTFKRNGKIIDQSPLCRRTPDDAPLQDRVLEARNTAFHQELWYEINREARTLLSSNVYSDSSSITWKQDTETDVIFTLEDLSEPDDTYETISDFECSATAYYIYMQFLLVQGHQQSYYRRTTMSQLQPNRGAIPQPYTILRAVISNSEYFGGCKAMADFLEDLIHTLKRAGFSTASCKSATQPLLPALFQGNSSRRNPKTELNLINHLVGRLESTFELFITPEVRIFVRSRIVIHPYIGVMLGISLTPFAPPNINNANANANGNTKTSNNKSNAAETNPNTNRPPTEQEQPSSLLELLYPPTQEPYSSAGEAIYYIRQATARAVAHTLAEQAALRLDRDDIEFAETVRGPGIINRNNLEVMVDISADTEVESGVDGWDRANGKRNGRLVLSLDARAPGQTHLGRRLWTWQAHRDDADGKGIVDMLISVYRDSRDG